MKIRGIKIYRMPSNPDSASSLLKNIGINTIFSSQELNSHSEYQDLIEEYRFNNFVITPIFYDPSALEKDSTLWSQTVKGARAEKDWLKFVCPSRSNFRDQKVEEIKKIVMTYNPDGISLDFIRFFVFWEEVYPDTPADSLPQTCFCENCLRKFQNKTGIKIPYSLNQKSQIYKWINENHCQKWINWKCDLITSMVEEIVTETRKIDKDLKINIHVLPWRESDFGGAIKNVAGQNIETISPYVDFISPMTYAHMVKQDSRWIQNVFNEMDRRAPGKILPAVQVAKTYRNFSLSPDDFQKNIQAVKESSASGIIIWSWSALSKSQDKQKVLEKIIQKK